VLVAAVRSRRPSLRALAWPSAAVLAVSVLAFERWRRSLPGNDEPRLGVDLAATAGHLLEALAWTGLVLSPVTLFLLARWRRPVTWWAVAVAGGLAVLLDAGLRRPLFPANYLSRRGAYQSAGLGVRAALVPEAVWLLVGVVAVVSAGVLLAWLATRPSGVADPVLTPFVALTLAGLLVEDLLGQTTYSRYLVALPPVLAVFLLRTAPRPAAVRARAAPAVLSAALCALAVVLSIGTLRSDAARWQVAQSLVDHGVAPMSIAAGQEWAGWHSAVVAVHARRDSPGDVAWWTGMFSDASECWLVAMDPGERAGYRLVRSASGVFVFRADGAC
jgi:hypothetical protein